MNTTNNKITGTDGNDAQSPPKTWTPEASTLAAKVAHELNNPLDAVLRYVALAQRKVRSHEYNDVDRYLADAQFGLQRMADILRELMDLGRQTNALLAAPTPLPVGMILQRAVRTLAAQAQARSVHITTSSDVPETVRLDPRLVQVLSNLLKNAIEASPAGAEVRIESRQQEKVLTVEVTDSGSGLPPQVLDELFVPFKSSKNTSTNAGLGLVICRELLAGINGTLTLENRVGGGCVARVVVPVA